MNKSDIISKHNEYNLVLNVYDYINDFRQHIFVADLKLYTLDGLLLTVERFSFPIFCKRMYNKISLAYEYYLEKLQSKHLLSTVAYDLYLKYCNENKD